MESLSLRYRALMTERTAMRVLWAASLLAAVLLVAGVKAFGASDEVLAFGTMILIVIGGWTVGQVTVHYGPSRRRDDD